MDNARKKTIRRIIMGIGGMLMVLALLIGIGIEFPFFNHYNPFYNAFLFVFIASVLFIARTFIKDIRTVGNFIDFAGPSGLVHTTYKVGYENITPTRANYIDKDGEKKSIRHGHPFVIPNKDVWLNEYIVMDNGLAALNPQKLLQKYGPELKDIEVPIIELEEKTEGKDEKGNPITVFVQKPQGRTVTLTKGLVQSVLSSLSAFIPEIQALDPMVLHKEQSSEDNVDGMNQEGAFQMTEIRKGWFSGGNTTKVIAFVAVGLVVGALVTLMYSIAFHLNFAQIGIIRSLFQ